MHILVTTDGLEHAREAVKFACQLASQAGAEVTVLGVAERAQRDGVARRAVADAGRLLAGQGVEHTTKLRYGHPAEQILQEIEGGDYDFVVIGARGRSRLTRFLLGSVSYRVLERSTIPVLIVRSSRPQVKKVLATTGGHPKSKSTMSFGAELARALGATQTLLHVTNPVPQMYTGLDEMDETLPELMKSDTVEGHALREGARIMNNEEIEGHIELRHGMVEEEIIREAVKGDYDLIVVGTSVPTGTLGWLALGNITRRVIDRTQRPILVVTGGN
ncbi:MAG: universal stress protein [Anaerolineae bacterium]